MSIDTEFVRALIADGSWDKAREAGVEGSWFFDEGHKAFQFVEEFFKSHGKMPGLETVEKHVGCPLGEAPEPISFYIERLKTRTLGNVLASGVEAAVKKLRTDPKTGPNLALEEIKALARRASDLDRAGNRAVVDLRDTTEERWSYYQEVKALGGVIDGIPTPWRRINERTRGIHPGELWVIVARLKTGKSWCEVVLAEHVWRNGQRPLLVSQEMAISTFARRIDARYAELPYSEFIAGMLDTVGEQRYRTRLDDMKLSETPLIVAGAGKFRTVEDIEILIEETRPTIVLIDGVYLMKDQYARAKGASKYDNVSRVVDELQVLAQRKNIPIVVSTQFNRKATKDKTDAGAEFIGYAYEIAQNAHCMIGMFRDADDEAAGRMKLRMMETRECHGLDLMVAWDLHKMDFHEIGVLNGDDLIPDSISSNQGSPVSAGPVAPVADESGSQDIPW